MKLNRKHIRKLILKEMAGMDDDNPPQGQIPPSLDMEDAYEGESDIIDVMQLISAMAAEIEGSHGGLDTQEAAFELVRRIDMAHPDTDGIDAVAESLAMAALDLILQNRSASRRKTY